MYDSHFYGLTTRVIWCNLYIRYKKQGEIIVKSREDNYPAWFYYDEDEYDDEENAWLPYIDEVDERDEDFQFQPF